MPIVAGGNGSGMAYQANQLGFSVIPVIYFDNGASKATMDLPLNIYR